ncbi:putative integral membrane protein, Mpv17/PMP22 family [Sphaerosporella brunnea]|uniref:Putative integral membrane protein, Mpv17/PMP22 family n=1 Tax=Sphaerosporella brunnea TaxID=1250544 RepID=A0A5J5EI33_9PEZI|nr:putative integral membrane protein, Mpv17/PMP22 family [Sphaerosporella brunnea]
MAIFTILSRRYDLAFKKRPILTMVVTNTILGSIADILAQTIEITTPQRRTLYASNATGTRKLELDEKLNQKLPRYGDQLVHIHSTSQPLPPSFDFGRLALFTSWGLVTAPLFFKWLRWLERAYPITTASTYAPVLKRVACDQLGFAPIGIAGFFAYMAYLEPGGNMEAVKSRLEQLYVPALKANYALWPAAQVVNFRLMPLKFQLPFSSMVMLIWGVYASLVNSGPGP